VACPRLGGFERFERALKLEGQPDVAIAVPFFVSGPLQLDNVVIGTAVVIAGPFPDEIGVVVLAKRPYNGEPSPGVAN
jgi:hypothetical protein